MTAARPTPTGNPAPRVFTCASCSGRFEAGARGPLPRRCVVCRSKSPAALRYRIASARAFAVALRRDDVVAALDHALGLVAAQWSPFRR